MKILSKWMVLCAAVLVLGSLGFSDRGVQAAEASHTGTISGIVRLQGPIPRPQPLEITKDKEICDRGPHYAQNLIVGKNRGIANAVVALRGALPVTEAKPSKHVKFDQIDCEYVPHVLAFVAGSTIDIINSDGILHNVHTYPKHNPPINMAQPGFKKMIQVVVHKPDIIKVTCDAHNWMEGWWYVADNPYFAVSGKDGQFAIKDVPPGDYTLTLWQEKLGTQTAKVKVEPGKTTSVTFTMRAKKG